MLSLASQALQATPNLLAQSHITWRLGCPHPSSLQQSLPAFSALQWLSVAFSGAAVVLLVGSLPTHTPLADNSRPLRATLGPPLHVFFLLSSTVAPPLRTLPSARPSRLSVRRAAACCWSVSVSVSRVFRHPALFLFVCAWLYLHYHCYFRYDTC